MSGPPNRRPHLRPRRPAEVDLCPGCGRDPWADDGPLGCDPKNVQGLTPEPHSWSEADREWPDPPGDDDPCSCGVRPGGYHHWECGLEICPWTATHPDLGEQLLCCGCFE